MDTDKQRYYALDDIGFLGSSTSGESEEVLREHRRLTVEYIKRLKAGKIKPGRRSAKKVRK